MSIYVRTKSGAARPRSLATMRLATSIVLLGYPLGTLMMVLMPDTTPEPGLVMGEIIGFALMLMSLIAFAVVAPSQFQRITGEETNQLDEREIDLRRRAYTFSFQVFTVLVLVAIMYMGLAGDLLASRGMTLWTPTRFDHWNAIFWGAAIYAFVLPTAYLAWTMPPPPADDDV
jgi:hypothetical protein